MRAKILAVAMLAALTMVLLALPASAHNTHNSLGAGGKLTVALLERGESQSLADVYASEDSGPKVERAMERGLRAHCRPEGYELETFTCATPATAATPAPVPTPPAPAASPRLRRARAVSPTPAPPPATTTDASDLRPCRRASELLASRCPCAPGWSLVAGGRWIPYSSNLTRVTGRLPPTYTVSGERDAESAT
jgi:hypothetical protein